MNDLTPLRAALDAVDPGDGTRIDGWTGARRRIFLESLAEGHTVEAACRFVGLSVASAYALRRRAGVEAFALGWRAAGLLGRDALADRLTSRAIDGQLDTFTRADGQEVTRHRFDNRRGLALLARLDRLAETRSEPRHDPEIAAPSPDDPLDAARTVADDFPAFLDLVDADADAARVRAFVEAAIARRTPQLPQLRDGEEDAGDPDPRYWWQDEEWRTSLPPPRGFRGDAFGVYGDPDYWRTMTRAEARAADAEADACLAAERAEGERLRDRLLGGDGG